MTEEQGRVISRRTALGAVTAAAIAVACPPASATDATTSADEILDSHVHVWDLNQFHLSWLDHDPLLRRDYSVADYLKAAEGLNIRRAVYVEVNVGPSERGAEAKYVGALCTSRETPFVGGVIAADPRDPGLGDFLNQFARDRAIKGLRFLYPADGNDDPKFIAGLRELGRRNLTFDLQLGPDHLADAAKTAAACPDTRFILDHCGGAEPRAFRKETENDRASRESREAWRRGIEAIAKQPNVWCKISGVADGALPGDATAEDVAPIVNFCLDHFGPDRVMFGGNWPVCLKSTTLRHWVESLNQNVAGRSEPDRRKLFRENATNAYRISDSDKLRSS